MGKSEKAHACRHAHTHARAQTHTHTRTPTHRVRERGGGKRKRERGREGWGLREEERRGRQTCNREGRGIRGQREKRQIEGEDVVCLACSTGHRRTLVNWEMSTTTSLLCERTSILNTP